MGEWKQRLFQLKKDGVIHCTWVGGEPLLRTDVIQECKNIFDWNWVITNGTIDIPDWNDVTFIVSVDGIKKDYEKIRGKGIYDKVKDNVMSSRSKNIYIDIVLNKINVSRIEPFLKEWNEYVNGITFDFYTPLSKTDDDLFIPLDERSKVIERLLELKKTYKIIMADKVAELMKSGNTVGKCLVPEYAISLDSLGNRKHPCVMGNVDCSRCGCILPYIMEALRQRDIDTALLLLKLVR